MRYRVYLFQVTLECRYAHHYLLVFDHNNRQRLGQTKKYCHTPNARYEYEYELEFGLVAFDFGFFKQTKVPEYDQAGHGVNDHLLYYFKIIILNKILGLNKKFYFLCREKSKTKLL